MEDLSVEERRLTKAGVSFQGPVVKPSGMTAATFRDPDGYTWTVAQRVGTTLATTKP